MKQRGMKRLRGTGCNSSFVKARVSDWKKRYDKSSTYNLKVESRNKAKITETD
jgi:hypothetical protein